MQKKTITNMTIAGKRYLIGVDYADELVEGVLDELFQFEKERNADKATLFKLAEAMIIHASIKALGAGIAIGKHVERQRKKAGV